MRRESLEDTEKNRLRRTRRPGCGDAGVRAMGGDLTRGTALPETGQRPALLKEDERSRYGKKSLMQFRPSPDRQEMVCTSGFGG